MGGKLSADGTQPLVGTAPDITGLASKQFCIMLAIVVRFNGKGVCQGYVEKETGFCGSPDMVCRADKYIADSSPCPWPRIALHAIINRAYTRDTLAPAPEHISIWRMF